MDENSTPTRYGRWRPVYVAWALIALVVLSACASTSLRSEADAVGDIRLDATVELDLAEPVLANTAFATDGAASVGEAQSSDRVDDALIVRTASLELEVADVAATLLSARDEIGILGGYVAGSDEYDQGDRRWASVTYRVPVDRFTDALDALRGLSERVVRESTQSGEITATVVDLDARIANLRASEAALVEIMDRSGRMEDVLAVQMRLEDVRGQIERLEAQRANLADQAALSTLTVAWFTPVAAVTVAQQGWDFGSEVDAALAQTVQALQGLAGLAVWFALVALPLLGLPLLVAAGLYLWLRRRTSRGGEGTGGEGGSGSSNGGSGSSEGGSSNGGSSNGGSSGGSAVTAAPAEYSVPGGVTSWRPGGNTPQLRRPVESRGRYLVICRRGRP